MNAELLKSLAYLLTGGLLAFLAITIIRDNITNRLNRVTGSLLLFAGLGPLSLALGVIIRQSATASVGFEDSTLYDLRFAWEFFFPFLLLFFALITQLIRNIIGAVKGDVVGLKTRA